MSEDDEGSRPPPKQDLSKDEGFLEPEDWDMPPVIIEEDECPEILENVEAEEAIETIFTNIHKSTIISTILGILLGITSIVLENTLGHNYLLLKMFMGFAAGVFLVFGASEIIILGVKGMSDKLNWNPYLEGILQAIGAALAELVVIIVLLLRSNYLTKTGIAENIQDANILAITAIVLILATVIINVFFLGIAILFVSRDEPFRLPKELTFFEANLVLGMMVFSFVIMLYGLFFEFDGIWYRILEGVTEPTAYNRYFEIIIGIALILVYIIFIVILITRFGKRTSTPQTLITEFFPEDEEVILTDQITPVGEIRLLSSGSNPEMPKIGNGKKIDKQKEEDPCTTLEEVQEEQIKKKWFGNGNKSKKDRNDALATLRRFPWIIIIVLFIIGAGGIVWGGEILAKSIEHGIDQFSTVPTLVYAVVVGIVSSSPELVVTLRGLFSGEKEKQEVGLVHQVSAINQTFFILFGVPFVLSGILSIGIPIALEITIVMGGIFIISVALNMMIMDDNHFDLLEGVVLTILSTVSLLALALIGGISTSQSTEATIMHVLFIANIY